MTALETALRETASALNIEFDSLSHAERGALVLIRASAEMSRHLDPSPYATQQILRWIHLLDANAGIFLGEQLLRDASSELPTWFRDRPEAVEDALPLPLLGLGLLTLIGPAQPANSRVWEYFNALVGADDLARSFLGWLRGEASAEVNATVDAQLQELAKHGKISAGVVDCARIHRYRRNEVKAGPKFDDVFRAARARLQRGLQALSEHSDAFGINRGKVREFLERIDNNHFRLAVLGEFKRGKSTLISALVDRPGVLPAATLPCTSALIELRYGEHEQYAVCSTSPPFDYRTTNEAEFRRSAGNAAKASSADQPRHAAGERVPRWRLTLPSPFLGQALLDIVDTPGIGEDSARDLIAHWEAQRADAAIVVLSAIQLGSQMDLDLIGSLQTKLENLIVVINRADEVPEKELPELQEHVLRRLRARGLQIPEERILLVSASKAEEALRKGHVGDPWLVRRDALRSLVVSHLLTRSGPAKAKALCGEAQKLSADSHASISALLARRTKDVRDLRDLQGQVRDTAEQYERAKGSIESAGKVLSYARDAAGALSRGFWGALPDMLSKIDGERASWTSDFHPVTSPKKHITEVAEKAKRALTTEIQVWATVEAVKVLEGAIQDRFDAASAKLGELRRFLDRAQSGNVERLIEDLKVEALEGAFGEAVSNLGSGSTVLRAMVVTALGLVLGYVIADILLFYVLGVIIGFLNPYLIAAALVLSVMAYFTKGDDFVRGWVRSKVFGELESGLKKPKVVSQIDEAFAKSAAEIFVPISSAFSRRALALLNELRAQQLVFEKELRDMERELGTAHAVEAEVRRLEDRARDARGALHELQSAISVIESELAEAPA